MKELLRLEAQQLLPMASPHQIELLQKDVQLYLAAIRSIQRFHWISTSSET